MSSERQPEANPKRGRRHDALSVFLGNWKADGTSYGGPDQSEPDPKANGVKWASTHVGHWHTGEFFLIQDEKARIGPDETTFDTLSVLGVDPENDGYFARTFENHGYYRHYAVTVEGRVWKILGPTERATIEFSADHRTQTIAWEWKRQGTWLPLCDRVAERLD